MTRITYCILIVFKLSLINIYNTLFVILYQNLANFGKDGLG